MPPQCLSHSPSLSLHLSDYFFFCHFCLIRFPSFRLSYMVLARPYKNYTITWGLRGIQLVALKNCHKPIKWGFIIVIFIFVSFHFVLLLFLFVYPSLSFFLQVKCWQCFKCAIKVNRSRGLVPRGIRAPTRKL